MEAYRKSLYSSSRLVTLCLLGMQASSTVFSQFLPFVALTRFWGVCFRSQRLRLARFRGEFSDGFLTVVAVTAMLYWLRSLLSSAIQSLRYQRLMASTCSRTSWCWPTISATSGGGSDYRTGSRVGRFVPSFRRVRNPGRQPRKAPATRLRVALLPPSKVECDNDSICCRNP